MQIHELNNFTGTLGSGAYLAVDDGNDTGKISSQGLLAATEARIDNIIAGPAPSAQEVTDARLGADGVTYSSLGTAIRTQVGDLKDNLNSFSMIEKFRSTQKINKAIDGVTFLLVTQTTNNTITTVDILYADHDIELNVKSGYKYIVATYTTNVWATSNHIANTSWQTGKYFIPKGTYFAVQLRKSDNSAFDNLEADKIAIAPNEFAYKEDVSGVRAEVAKDFDDISIINKFRNAQRINKAIDGITFLLVTQTTNKTITTTDILYAEHEIEVDVEPDYKYLIHTYTSNVWATSNHIASSGWQTGKYTIPKGSYFAVQLARVDGAAFANLEADKYVVTPNEFAYKEDVEEKPTLYHILVTGQSLAVGAEGNPALTVMTPLEYIGKSFQFNGGSRPLDGMENNTGVEEIAILDQCLDSLVSLREQDHILTLGDGEDQRHAYQGETISSTCGYTFTKLTGQMCLVSEHGFGGKSYNNLKKGTIAYNNAIRAVYHAKDLCDRLGWNYIVLAIAVVHGEADLTGGTSATTYKNDLIEWLNDFDTDCKAITGQTQDLKLYVSQTCAQSAYGLSGNPIATGVLDACRANSNIRFVAPQYGHLFTYASIHMNNYGYRYLGEYFGQQIGRDFNNSDVNTVFPTSISRNGTTITVSFNHLTDLHLDVSNVLQTSDGNYGFRLYDPANNAQIQSVTLSNNQIVIQTDVTAGYYAHLQYAYAPTQDEMGFIGSQKGVRGCLRDSSGVTSLFDNTAFLVNWCAEFDIVVTSGDL